MSFTARTLGRAMGTGARIQPRIAPITAPDSWQGPSELEFLDVEIAARPRPETREPAVAREPAPPIRSPEDLPPRPRAPEPERASIAAPSEPAPPAVASRRAAAEIESHVERTTPTSPRTEIPDPSEPRAPARVSTQVPSFRAQRLIEPLPVPTRIVRAPSPVTLDEHEVEVESSPRTAELPKTIDSDVAARPPDFRSIEQRPIEPRPVERRVPSELESPEAPTAAWTNLATNSERLPPSRRRANNSESSGPIVRVEIGRVELRAPPSQEQPKPTSIPKPEGFVSLKDYLRERGKS